MQVAHAALDGEIVTFGVVPTYPSSAHGYIQTHAQSDQTPSAVFKVDRFIEKPQALKAQELILQGNVCWNAGIFLCTAEVLLKALKEHAPDILACCEDAMAQATETLTSRGECLVQPKLEPLKTCRSESIDYSVMEQAQNIALVKFTGQWSDVGSWNAVAKLTPADE
jgi:mannose-1-phosphate guanylyltransferase/mannose-6-phosphate isomerase